MQLFRQQCGFIYYSQLVVIVHAFVKFWLSINNGPGPLISPQILSIWSEKYILTSSDLNLPFNFISWTPYMHKVLMNILTKYDDHQSFPLRL